MKCNLAAGYLVPFDSGTDSLVKMVEGGKGKCEGTEIDGLLLKVK